MKINIPKPKAKLNRTPEQAAWLNMRSKVRCPSASGYRPNTPLQPEWEHDFQAFLSDVGYRPSKEYVLKMKDPNKGFVRGNMEWAHGSYMQYRQPTSITYKGETLPLSAWAKRTGIAREILRARLKAGWKAEQILEEEMPEPKQRARLFITYKEETLTIKQWSDRLGINWQRLYMRKRNGWTDAQILGFEERPRKRRKRGDV